MENEYFKAKLQIFPHSGKTLHGRIVISRKDTEEEITSLNIRSEDKEHIEHRLNERLEDYFESTEPPSDFGNRDRVEFIVSQYQRAKQKNINIRLYIEDNFQNRTLDEKSLTKALKDLVTSERNNSEQSFKLISSLDEDEKIRLVTSSDQTYKNIKSSGFALDDAQARLDLMEYIIEPNEKVKCAHEDHMRRLGW